MALLTQEFLPQFKEQKTQAINIEEPHKKKVLHKVQFSPHQNLQLEV
jgi:hypothetical protein